MGYEEHTDIFANMSAWQRNKLLKMVADMATERKIELESVLAELDVKIKLTVEGLEKADADLLQAREKLAQIELERDAADKLILEYEKNPEEYTRQAYLKVVEYFSDDGPDRKIYENAKKKFEACIDKSPEAIEEFDAAKKEFSRKDHSVQQRYMIKKGGFERTYMRYMCMRRDMLRCEAKFEMLTEQLNDLKSQQKLAVVELEEINA